ncbi:lipoprotein BA_5634 family protein [Lysinibacillus sp. CNPSo 3705]|uniref:lipoprotein BA_5634 family protein n=1 Tax=Lysinibacillus sp. CNPSo 3705 TaxID=3028148 RepID=UPI002363C7B2|nr:lipoprotein BA_5634 family protein [Lysinibacillus sp. CNPSo 3705]MDD1505677.1 lipoprotein BA_5634 family protein [Lysinibacillus sp. CNPSo 3705]
MKKIIGFVLVIVIFLGIGYGVKRFIQGPPQPANGIVVIGTEQDVNKVKQEYKNKTEQTYDYKAKFIVTKKGESEHEYLVINKTTAEQLVKKGIIRARKEPGSSSLISEPVNEIKELPGSLNLFYSISDYELVDNQIDLNGRMIPVSYIKNQIWVGYMAMDFVILNDKTYDELADPDSVMTLIHLKDKFDYKEDKEEVEQVFKTIENVYPDSKRKVGFVDIED